MAAELADSNNNSEDKAGKEDYKNSSNVVNPQWGGF